MIAVIFEAFPQAKYQQTYLDLAAALKPELQKIDGFISVERFQSLTDPAKLLSLSFWRDEQAVMQWRQLEAHRKAQARGRETVFSDYRLRVAHVLRDYGLADRDEAPTDNRVANG